jgi:hypothetical protein
LNGQVVLTKNKNEVSEKNFRVDPKNPKIMLDGYWAGKPKNVEVGGYCAHYVVHKMEIWIGEYGGAVPLERRKNERQRYSLMMKNSVRYKISDIDAPENSVDPILINNFLHKNGAVTYTYFSSRLKNKDLKKSESDFKDENITGSEVLRVLSTRVNHGKLRTRTLRHFNGRCCITGIDMPQLLICSHIKPWSKSTGSEKTDHNNVLLLASNWDAAFDKGLISIKDDGGLIFSKTLNESTKKMLGISTASRIDPVYLTDERRNYLSYHRNKVFIDDSYR